MCSAALPVLVGAVCTKSPLAVAATLPARAVARLLTATDRGALPVLRDGVVVGMITRAALRSHGGIADSAGTLVRRRAVIVREGDSLLAALAAMTAAHAEHAVVVENGNVVGTLSDGQAIRGLAPSREVT